MGAMMNDQPDGLHPTSTNPEDAIKVFEEQFKDSTFRLLEPIDPVVNYSFEVIAADPWTLELSADKWWLEPKGHIGHASQTLQSYPIDTFEKEYETEREIAQMDCEMLRRIHHEQGLEAVMEQAERIACANKELASDRMDGRLFQDGPTDRFVTMREAKLESRYNAIRVPGDFDISGDDTEEIPIANTNTWANVPAEANGKYWQLQALPVESPEGEKQGVSLFLTEFPQLPANFDEYVEQNGLDDTIYPTEARMIEIVHLTNINDAREFEDGFRSCLVPGVLEGPDFAPEVARLNGLTDSWQQLAFTDVLDVMMGESKVIRDETGWRLSNQDSGLDIASEDRSTPNGDIEF
jgi:hypothetical protein